MNDLEMNNCGLNVDKILPLMEGNISRPDYHCPYTEAGVLLERMKTLRAQNDLKWIEQAAHYYACHSHLDSMNGIRDQEYAKTAHKLYAWMCEGSHYIPTIYPDQIKEKRDEIEKCIDDLRNRQATLKLIEDQKTYSFVSSMLPRLKMSNYILFPERKAKTLFYFLAYDSQLLANQLPLITEIIYLMKTNGLLSAPTNLEIQKLLKQEIDQYEEIINGLWFTDARDILKSKITEAVPLITLALLNSEHPEKEGINKRVLSARLCRYLSKLDIDSLLSDQLKNKAYTILTNESSLNDRIGWNELLHFELLHFIAQIINIHIDASSNASADPQEDKWEQYSNGKNSLTLDKDGFTLSSQFTHATRSWRGRKEKVALMDNRVFIASFSKPTYLFNACKSIADFQLYWHQLAEDYPLFRQPDSPDSLPAETASAADEEPRTDYPEINEEITIGIIGPDATKQYIEGIVLDDGYRGQKAILPLTQINACYFCIPDFEQYFVCNDTYKVKVMEINKEGIRVSLAQSYNDFVYAENVQRKKLPAMIAEYEGNKIKWLLSTGSTCTTSTNRWIKPKTGDIYQVEFLLDTNGSKPKINVGKVKADITEAEFKKEVCQHLSEFTNHLRKYQIVSYERKKEERTLKEINNPFANALQKLNLDNLLLQQAENTETEIKEEETDVLLAPRAEQGINHETAQELIFCLDQLATGLEEPIDRFNAYNFLRLLCCFTGSKNTATYYELCADYIYEINQLAIQPYSTRFSQENIQRFNILSARMEQLGVKQYAASFGFCQQIIHILCAIVQSDSKQLEQLICNEDRTIAELARYFRMIPLLTEDDTDLQHIIYKNINTLLGVKSPEKKGPPSIPVYFGHEGVEREFKSSAFIHPDKDTDEDQSMALARVIASFMNTDGGTLYIGVNDNGYLTGIQQDMRFVHNDCDIYLRTVNRNILRLLGDKQTFNRYQEYIRCDFHEYGNGRMVLAFRVPPINEVVKVNGTIYTRSGSSCIGKPQENISGFTAIRHSLKLDSTPRLPEFPTVFSAEKGEYVFAQPTAITAPSPLLPAIAEEEGKEKEEMPQTLFPFVETLSPATPAPKKKKTSFNISTSCLRNNPLQKKAELGYTGSFLFVSIFANGKIACSPSPKIGVWGGDEAGKVFFSYDTEGNEEYLVSVFTTGEVGISNLKKGITFTNVPTAFVNNVNELMFCSPASKDKYLLLIAEKNGDKRYRIIRLSDFEKSMSIQPKLTTLLIPEKGRYIFAEILDEDIMKDIEDDKISLDSFDEYNAGRIWEHTSYKNGLDTISRLCGLSY